MKKHQKQIFTLTVTLVFATTALLLTGLSEAGKPEKPNPEMDMLQDIYDIVLDTNSKIDPEPCEPEQVVGVPKTGQTISYGIGDDGDLQKGIAWPDPRFTDNSDGTVTDNLTGLIWLQNANCDGVKNWNDALTFCNMLSSGQCGLTDGSNEWRLPNIKELNSLIDFSNVDPPLPSGHPFDNVFETYWSSTTYAGNTPTGMTYAWTVRLDTYYVSYGQTLQNGQYVWCVRNGN